MHAGEWERAADYHQQAGDRARAVYAHAEAVAHYTQALEALARLPGSVNAARKYELHLAREAVRNFVGDRQEQAEDLKTLQALAEAQNDMGWQTEVALRQAHYAQVTGDYPAAIEMAQVAVRLAHSQDQKLSLMRRWGISNGGKHSVDREPMRRLEFISYEPRTWPWPGKGQPTKRAQPGAQSSTYVIG
jgi:hypothetical protein